MSLPKETGKAVSRITHRLHEKGDNRRTIDVHFTAAEAITEYLAHAGIRAACVRQRP